MIFLVSADGQVRIGAATAPCALGRDGVCAASDKRERDGKTPAGLWPIRQVLWRADRLSRPATALPARPINPADGWCDAPSDPLYNQPVTLPYPASAEQMWREDGLYDLVAILGYNDDPVIPGAGSAIFLHIARPGFEPTEGCVAVAPDDIRRLLSLASPGSLISISGPGPGAQR